MWIWHILGMATKLRGGLVIRLVSGEFGRESIMIWILCYRIRRGLLWLERGHWIMCVRLGRPGCLHGRIECLVGYITSLGMCVWWWDFRKRQFLVWRRSRLDTIVKVDGVILIRIIRSIAVRGWTWVDWTIFTDISIFATSLTRRTVRLEWTTLGECEQEYEALEKGLP